MDFNTCIMCLHDPTIECQFLLLYDMVRTEEYLPLQNQNL